MLETNTHTLGTENEFFNTPSDLDLYKGKPECFVHMKPDLGTCYFRTDFLNTTFMHKLGGVFSFFLKHRNTQMYIETFKPLSLMLNLTT